MDCSFITESWELFYSGIFKLTKVLTRVVKIMTLLGFLKLCADWEARPSAYKCSWSNSVITFHHPDNWLSILILKDRFPLQNLKQSGEGMSQLLWFILKLGIGRFMKAFVDVNGKVCREVRFFFQFLLWQSYFRGPQTLILSWRCWAGLIWNIRNTVCPNSTGLAYAEL